MALCLSREGVAVTRVPRPMLVARYDTLEQVVHAGTGNKMETVLLCQRVVKGFRLGCVSVGLRNLKLHGATACPHTQ